MQSSEHRYAPVVDSTYLMKRADKYFIMLINGAIDDRERARPHISDLPHSLCFTCQERYLRFQRPSDWILE
jgi:hypothetical protein